MPRRCHDDAGPSGLGATRDPALVQQIGRAVAEEVSGTGIDWDFAPCLCVARNDRWGRTYESFGETPEMVTPMATIVITTVLKGELGFSGFVVTDWAGIDQIDGQPGFTGAEIRTAINAGIDMVMVPSNYRSFISLLRGEVQAGRVPMSRIDDANRRVLTKKFQLGLFERPLTDRSFTGTVGSAAHRALARQGVRESQVLLKNTNGILPLPKTASKIFVAGKSANDIGNQSGGWTISWQGSSGATTPGTTILQAIRSTVSPSTTVTFSANGSGIDGTYKAAIAVVGKTPYAEGAGDRPGGMGLDSTDLATLSTLRAAGVPLVVVLVSGRPLDVATQLSELGCAGGGVAAGD